MQRPARTVVSDMEVDEAPERPKLYTEVRTGFDSSNGAVIQIQVSAAVAVASSTGPGAPSASNKSARYRRLVREAPIFDTQDGYSRHHLATASSVHWASSSTTSREDLEDSTTVQHPRNILWRVVNGRRTLELRSADTVHHYCLKKKESHEKHKNTINPSIRPASNTIQLLFDQPIQEYGLALADHGRSKHQYKHETEATAQNQPIDDLEIFVLTQAHEIYALSLPRAFFHDITASERLNPNSCQVLRPATFSLSLPLRITVAQPAITDESASQHQLSRVAVTLPLFATEIIVSLCDGRLLRLLFTQERKSSKWIETVYGTGNWGSSIRGLIRWQGNDYVQYGNLTLNPSTPLALKVAPNGQHVFGVCMNHTLRAWSPHQAGAIMTQDLLGLQRSPQDAARMTIDPANCQGLMQIFASPSNNSGDAYYVMVYSPHDFGQFKIWAVRDIERADAGGIRALCPDVIMRAPDPKAQFDAVTVWRIVDFRIQVHNKADGDIVNIWLLYRAGQSHYVFTLSTNLEEIASAWQDEWTAASIKNEQGQIPNQPLISTELDETNITDEWLGYIMKSGRFPTSLLDSALLAFRTTRKMPPQSSRLALSERLRSSMESIVSKKHPKATFSQRQAALHDEWLTFWQDLKDYDGARFEVLSLAIQPDPTASSNFAGSKAGSGLPWIISADCVAPLRRSTRSETIADNSPEALLALSEGDTTYTSGHETIRHSRRGSKLTPPNELAVILSAAAELRRVIQNVSQRLFENALTASLWNTPATASDGNLLSDSCQSFYSLLEIEEDLADALLEDVDRMLESIGGASLLSSDAIETILQMLHDPLLVSNATSSPDTGSLNDLNETGYHMIVSGARDMIDHTCNILLDILALNVFIEGEIDQSETPMKRFNGDANLKHILQLLRPYLALQWIANTPIAEERGLSSTGKSEEPQKMKDRATGSEFQSSDYTSSRTTSTTSTTILQAYIEQKILALTKPKTQSTKLPSNVSLSRDLTTNIQNLLRIALIDESDTGTKSFDDAIVAIGCFLLQQGKNLHALRFAQYLPFTPWAMYVRGRLDLVHGRAEDAAKSFEAAASGMASYLSQDEASYLAHGLALYYEHIIEVFLRLKSSYPAQAAKFAQSGLALGSSELGLQQKSKFLESLFYSCLKTDDIKTASDALKQSLEPSKLLPDLLNTILSSSKRLPYLLSLDWPNNLHIEISRYLSDSRNNKNPKILASWYLHHNDFRGAASALMPSLLMAQARANQGLARNRGKLAGQGRAKTQRQKEDIVLEQDYLTIINLLSCVGPENAWVLCQDRSNVNSGEHTRKSNDISFNPKSSPYRRIVTLAEVRANYQAELARRKIIASGDFDFVGHGDDINMDLDLDLDLDLEPSTAALDADIKSMLNGIA